ncbi:MAG: proton extrusion protein PcxA [Cyanosarcina radialis HA8281-LM2]|jgi:hypothetical protein|nr:proton extrusion protein PcxA [Cyanosarcina radialis HA8281-LM2]
MKIPILSNLQSSLRKSRQWLSATPERSLEEAYQAALNIKAIEDEHFGGNKISARAADYSDNVVDFWISELNKYLNKIKIRLAEFKTSRSIVNVTESPNRSKYYSSVNERDSQALIVERLNFIDRVLTRYNSALMPVERSSLVKVDRDNLDKNVKIDRSKIDLSEPEDSLESISDKTGLLPRSILGTFKRLKEELDPNAEEKFVQNFRNSKNKTFISLRFILILILLPIVVQICTKIWVVGPIVDRVTDGGEKVLFVTNIDLEKEAFLEWEIYEKELEFKSLIGLTPPLSPEEKEEKIKGKVSEIKDEYSRKSADALKNVFADIFSFIAFVGVVVFSKKDIAVLKSFIDEIVYGLSDSAKAFIIILLTDIFVGYHSPHGWEIILGSISRHLGLPENRDFNFLFIATFPVILDTVFKYWIFRYLNRISPSAVATYRNMNE